MTTHPIDTEALREHLRRLIDASAGPGNPTVSLDDLRALLAAILAAEHRATRAEERIKAVERLTYASDDGTEYEHNGHGPAEGEPECPGCWSLGIRRALDGDA